MNLTSKVRAFMQKLHGRPDITDYLALLDRFISGHMPAKDFQVAFLSAVKSEARILGNPVYPILQTMFEDADAYVADPMLRTAPEDLDDEALRERAEYARQALRRVGYE
jgi:hypothetical protein